MCFPLPGSGRFQGHFHSAPDLVAVGVFRAAILAQVLRRGRTAKTTRPRQQRRRMTLSPTRERLGTVPSLLHGWPRHVAHEGGTLLGHECPATVSYTHLRAHETPEHLVCRL